MYVSLYMCLILRFVLDGFPVTKHQAELLESCSIIPMLLIELQLDTAEVLRRGLKDRGKNRLDQHKNSQAPSDILVLFFILLLYLSIF